MVTAWFLNKVLENKVVLIYTLRLFVKTTEYLLQHSGSIFMMVKQRLPGLTNALAGFN